MRITVNRPGLTPFERGKRKKNSPKPLYEPEIRRFPLFVHGIGVRATNYSFDDEEFTITVVVCECAI